MEADFEVATLGGGCFWCLEAVFEQLAGVRSVVSGYSGGHVDDPDYAAVCTGSTGHAEVVRITFDPARCSYRQLLEVFFAIHDPTTKDRQGHDVGSQYRSVIFCHSPGQQATAASLIRELDEAGLWPAPIVTELRPEAPFFPAETYHREYYRRNPGQGYCQVVIGPKVASFRKKFAGRLKDGR
ncbi:peptide-methionine (S)-S-oxide reductase MsrA [Accumulibacter sp.]|uniref:peptide-methionine (S)-S-oxide reductase MsrA n=1 Tax=Accumulibacter sp. TaxID=2053492 RepID=UPI0025DE6315|nr:peptide-methionine (S)-S-oxide reductase MsrA [Accumulibacter sp.]MCM8596860.1 peptide-methionine (S)-S-oxide reductase MsrA [Accumulibacter sp.]MCM8624606.1 peptide-methionine (S)-S-oxide reductase MsrA [Accumulibacter sp.]MDS4051008.1 peptide-methionine (S)-S-oxide reductase MsrA [Accumulibacter sp.]